MARPLNPEVTTVRRSGQSYFSCLLFFSVLSFLFKKPETPVCLQAPQHLVCQRSEAVSPDFGASRAEPVTLRVCDSSTVPGEAEASFDIWKCVMLSYLFISLFFCCCLLFFFIFFFTPNCHIAVGMTCNTSQSCDFLVLLWKKVSPALHRTG